MSKYRNMFSNRIMCLLFRPLQRMVVGMVIGGLAFMVAGFVQISVQAADTSLSSGHAKVSIHKNK